VVPGSARAAQTTSVATNWARILGAGLVVSAGVLVVAAIVDDFVPPFAGAADDPAAAAMAGELVAAGLTMMGGSTANLPASTMPAHIQATATVTGQRR
jgi:phosphate/sulfate permease